MPRVTQRYGGRKVGTDALPGVRKTAAETAASSGGGGDAVADVLVQAGSKFASQGVAMFSDIQQKERARADDVALLKASNQIDAWELATLNDPKTGALNLRGEASFELPEKIDGEWRKLTGDIEKGLGTPRQRQAFQQLKAQRGQNIALNVRRHVAGEMRDFETQELRGTLDNAVSLAGQNFSDPKRVGQEIAKGDAAITLSAGHQGLGPEARKALLEGFHSSAHLTVIQNMLANEQDRAAGIYFEEVKGEIAGDKLDEVRKAIEIGGRKRDAMQQADDILKAGGTLAQQREKAKAITDPDTRDMVMGRLEHEDAVNEKTERDTKEKVSLDAVNIVERTGRFDAIPASLLSQLSEGQRSSLRSYALQKARGIPVETDLPTYYALLEQAGKDPETFLTQNLIDYRAKLDDAEFKQIAGIQLSLRNGNRSQADKDLAGFRTKSEIIENTLQQYGIETKAADQTPADKRAIAQLQRQLDQRVDELQGDGKKLSNVEIQKELDRILSQGTDVAGSVWNIWPGGKPGPFGTTRKRLVDTTIDDIPAAVVQAITEKRTKRHMPVSEAAIIDTYIHMQLEK